MCWFTLSAPKLKVLVFREKKLNYVDPDQAAPSDSLIWVYVDLFALQKKHLSNQRYFNTNFSYNVKVCNRKIILLFLDQNMLWGLLKKNRLIGTVLLSTQNIMLKDNVYNLTLKILFIKNYE